MFSDPTQKYSAFPSVPLFDRRWPNQTVTNAPIWCSVDLRDGNQALPVPMNISQKLEMFQALVRCGFKEIEVGFPSASNTEFEFNRRLIEESRIPDDVAIQVLVQAREDLIERTIDSLRGAKNVIIHLYNSTSPAQRRVVFNLSKGEIIKVAIRGATWIQERLPKLKGANVRLQYSPESFSATEVEFAKEICEAVVDVWKPSPDRKIIVNLPDTVEVAMPNVYADQIEWMNRHLKDRDSLILSVHTHNDRGTGVAATELAMLAGAERVEGTLFGNGERTGNVDVMTLALNLYSQGVDPELTIADIDAIIETVEYCNRLPVHPRHPYAGELVYTAFSGSHQDAIKKGFDALAKRNDEFWEVPYLPIDPKDVGRTYESVIRVNSQSGKGGVAYLLKTDHGLELPRALQVEFSRIVQAWTDRTGKEASSSDIWTMFRQRYLGDGEINLIEYRTFPDANGRTINATIMDRGDERIIEGHGSGPLDAFVDALRRAGIADIAVLAYHEHAIGAGSDAQAAAYVEARLPNGGTIFGVAIDRKSVV